MKLSNVFEQLAFGELSQLSISKNQFEKIGITDVAQYKELIPHINLALTELHTRFFLKSSELILQQNIAVNTYILNLEHAVSEDPGSSPETYYIVDTVGNPFKNDLLKIEQVFDEEGVVVPLNDSTDTDSVFTPTYNTLQIPFALTENSNSIIYRADHEKIVYTNGFDPATVSINIPYTHLHLLLIFVAARYYGSQNMTEESTKLFGRYEFNAKSLQNGGYIVKGTEQTTNHKLVDRGFA
jgi:hypothetical protein